ncbi:MAG: ATP-binding cassette domain-containing protein [Halanaerobium sp.]
MLLEVKEIEKWFGSRKLFLDINFKIYSGDRIALIGRNGTGKTTMINITLILTKKVTCLRILKLVKQKKNIKEKKVNIQ